ncbi:MAG: leucine-rich repeat domain-containing protein, partial [Ruminococcus sp.]
MVFVLIFSVFSTSAVTYVSYGDYKYAKIADFKVYVAQYTGTDSKYYFTVPASPSAGVSTTGVYQNFMKDNTDIKSITLPDTVESIQDMAFSGCSSLTSFSMPVNLTTIGADVFRNTGISNIQFNSKLKTIGDSAFSYNSDLSIVSLPNSVTTIGRAAFSNCEKLKYVTIPASVKSIGD